ncbi:MAG: hypothetical protein AAFO81_07035 [Pseudomonadota bacterium]
MRTIAASLFALAVTLIAGCQSVPDGEPTASEVTFGDGTQNWIRADDVSRVGDTFVFSEVHIANNGWLVLHPFKDGRPVGEIYAGATYITAGTSKRVPVSVDAEPAPGTRFLVMLHRDVNENQQFDFVFVDERNVLDKAVFEGSTMISHIFVTP